MQALPAKTAKKPILFSFHQILPHFRFRFVSQVQVPLPRSAVAVGVLPQAKPGHVAKEESEFLTLWQDQVAVLIVAALCLDLFGLLGWGLLFERGLT